MTSSVPDRRSPCPVACTLDLIGDRWTLLIVRDLLFGYRHFHDFMNSPEGIASNILTDRLARLQTLGLVQKQNDPTDRRRITYTLTPLGQSLRPILRTMADWGLHHLPGTREARSAPTTHPQS
ncbi:MAG: helix-turn-helix domain-containing protein [Verrucomicrobiia bacterium]